jgi:hypothetical protein
MTTSPPISGPASAALEQLRDALTTAWAERPPSERAAALGRIAQASTEPVKAAISSGVSLAKQLAAVSGAVSPEDLLAVAGGGADGDRPDPNVLAPLFDRSARDGRWAWTLRSGQRAHALRAFLTQDRSVQRSWLARLEGALPTDQAGALLREILIQGAPGPGELKAMLASAKQDVAQAWAQALTWAAAGGLDTEAAADLARRQASVESILAGYDYLLSQGFFGRETQLEQIRRFTASLTPQGRIPILSVNGIGGAGKSTLLAAALRPISQQGFDGLPAPMIINVDFDRRLIIEGGELELSFELSRQIGFFVPEAADGLSRLRQEARRGDLERGEVASLETVSDIFHRRGGEFEYRMAQELRLHDLPARSLVIVLDTFEEWERETSSSFDPDAPLLRIMEWIETIRSRLGLAVGVILSGRTPRDMTGFQFVQPPILLEDLSAPEAKALLRGQGLTTRAADGLYRAVGGNPLVLKLAASYYANLSPERRKHFLEDEADELSEVDRKLVLGVLYQRFLNHIADPDARQLAHPGLALRWVTPELIREVLAGPCGLGEISEAKSRRLFDLLAREVWLVERRGDRLYHRPQIRTSMLRFMRKDPEKHQLTTAVHEVASRWWSGLKGREAAIEAAYHDLAAMRGDEILEVREPTRSFLPELTETFDEFEPGVAVQARLALGLAITEEQGAKLPQPVRSQWANRRSAALTARNSPKRAMALWRRYGGAEPEGPWRSQAGFQGLLWDDWVSETPQNPLRRRKYDVLLAHVSPNPDVRAARLAGLMDPPATADFERALRGMKRFDDTALENAYFLSLLEGPPDGHPLSEWSEERVLAGPITATDWQRYRALGGKPILRHDFNVQKLLNGAFRPSFDWLLEVARTIEASGARATSLHDLISDLESAVRTSPRQETTTASALLGFWAERFAEVVLDIYRMRGMHPMEALGALPHDRGDDPEWRLPIRLALSDVFRTAPGVWTLNAVLGDVLPIRPSDFDLQAPWSAERGIGRGAWVRIVEFVDRAGAMPALLGHELMHTKAPPDLFATGTRGRAVLRSLTFAYLEWDRLCWARLDRGQHSLGLT